MSAPAPATTTASSGPLRSDALVVFGATGDLAYKEIFPALHAMVRRGTLDAPVVCFARSKWTLEQLRARARDAIEHHPAGLDRGAFDKLCARLHYAGGDYGDPATFQTLRRELGSARRPLHYLAIPPSAFPIVIEGLAKSGCTGLARVALEKPFGRDLASAHALNETLHQAFAEPAIFRIDHFLGKEPVLNLLYFRFANRWLESVLDRDHVDSVQMTMAETFGVRGRGKFYEETGAIRDVIQNHLLQLTAILAMDAPVGRCDVEATRDEKARVLKAMAPLDPARVVRGQCSAYRDEAGVAPDSTVETFAALELRIDSWRWAGVPFFIRAGKYMPIDAIEVRVQFKRPPHDVHGERSAVPEYFRFRVGPDVNALAFGMHVKRPGEAMVGRDTELLASQEQSQALLPYERLLGDAMRGDASLFARQDAIEAQWRIVDPVLDDRTPIHFYQPGTWGPAEADGLVAGAAGGWLRPIQPAGVEPPAKADRRRTP
jgi:glucose-6-phosphate 1-dehydrogenase